MKYDVLFKEEANLDVFEARNWYESRRIGLGEELLDEIEGCVNILKRDPQIYRIRKRNCRYCPLKRFPYVIVYEIFDRQVIVFAVFNTYQHPRRLDIRRGKLQ